LLISYNLGAKKAGVKVIGVGRVAETAPFDVRVDDYGKLQCLSSIQQLFAL
jgi:hypothetical protein